MSRPWIPRKVEAAPPKFHGYASTPFGIKSNLTIAEMIKRQERRRA